MPGFTESFELRLCLSGHVKAVAHITFDLRVADLLKQKKSTPKTKEIKHEQAKNTTAKASLVS